MNKQIKFSISVNLKALETHISKQLNNFKKIKYYFDKERTLSKRRGQSKIMRNKYTRRE